MLDWEDEATWAGCHRVMSFVPATTLFRRNTSSLGGNKENAAGSTGDHRMLAHLGTTIPQYLMDSLVKPICEP